jgi:hypothetical protein
MSIFLGYLYGLPFRAALLVTVVALLYRTIIYYAHLCTAFSG